MMKNRCKACYLWDCRCMDCIRLIKLYGEWFCDEAQDYCKNIKECNNYSDEAGCDR